MISLVRSNYFANYYLCKVKLKYTGCSKGYEDREYRKHNGISWDESRRFA